MTKVNDDWRCRVAERAFPSTKTWQVVHKSAISDVWNKHHWQPLEPWMEERMAVLDMIEPSLVIAGRTHNELEGVGYKQFDARGNLKHPYYVLIDPEPDYVVE